MSEATRPIFGGGCSAHVIDLLIQDIDKLDFLKTIESKAVAVTTYVRDYHDMLSQFRTILSDTQCDHHRQLALPVRTRWTTLKKLLTEPEFADLVKASASTKKAAEKLIVAFLDPVIEALRELESDNCSASRVYSRFRWLLNHPTYGSDDERTDVQESLVKKIDDRWAFAHTDAIGLAFLLDPHTADISLRSKILERLNASHADINRALNEFAAEKRDWTPEKRSHFDGVAPRTYCEWSIMDFIHSKKRNRLTTGKVDMLACIYVNHHAVEKENADWASLQSYPE
ncbi:hypothetical protein PHMEG_00026040, partial [Phytophthora megakarya]